MSALKQDIERAAQVLRECDAVMITAGAGMGVDSGLPDFRGNEGFWRAYPPCKHLGVDFTEMSSPPWFEKDPTFAWGFWGHRYMLYRDVIPHAGFHYLFNLAQTKKDYFIFTSNVDGEFQKVGFPEDRIIECHGTVHLTQCTKSSKECPGGADCWPSARAGKDDTPLHFDVDPETFRVPSHQMPHCIHCGAMARPHVWMASKEWNYNHKNTQEQQARYDAFYERVKESGMKLAIIEIGAGTAIPSVRRKSEQTAEELKGTLIRINLREAEVPPPDGMYVLEDFDSISLPMKGLEGIQSVLEKVNPALLTI